jgi:hypothetical protein
VDLYEIGVTQVSIEPNGAAGYLRVKGFTAFVLQPVPVNAYA